MVRTNKCLHRCGFAMAIARLEVEVCSAPRSVPLGVPHSLHLWGLGALCPLKGLRHHGTVGAGEDAASVGVGLGETCARGREGRGLTQVLQVGVCGWWWCV